MVIFAIKEKAKKSLKMAKELNIVNTNKEKMLKALELSLGNVTEACKKCKLSRTIYYMWMQDDKDFADAVKYIDEQRIDFVESQMFKRIKGYSHKETKVFNHKGTIIEKDVIKHYPPDSSLISFFLETKAQSRGYQRRQFIENANTDPFDGMTEEEIDEVLAGIEAEEKAEAEKTAGFKKV